MVWYDSKMQVCVSLEDAIQLIKIFGNDYFTEINVRNRNLNLIETGIQFNIFVDNRNKLLLNKLRKMAKQKQGLSFEFIKK